MSAEVNIKIIQGVYEAFGSAMEVEEFTLVSIAANDTDVHSVATINQAVERILTLKFQLGLFNHPLVNASTADAAVTAGRTDTLRAARESITLLRNQNNTLPLSPTSKIVVTGPNADSMTRRAPRCSRACRARTPT
jgi:beta-glucosidase-like glycosyl hydrolase